MVRVPGLDATASLLPHGGAQDWSWEIAKVWLPANCIFVGMLWTSFPPLQV